MVTVELYIARDSWGTWVYSEEPEWDEDNEIFTTVGKGFDLADLTYVDNAFYDCIPDIEEGTCQKIKMIVGFENT